MNKKPHPADVAAEANMINAIRGADHFVASLFVGRGNYISADRPTVREAVLLAYELEADERAHTRRAMISAVSQDGVATFLTDALLARLGITRSYRE